MIESDVEILLVEDNPSDVKLALCAFKTHHLANHVHVARDGAEALFTDAVRHLGYYWLLLNQPPAARQ